MKRAAIDLGSNMAQLLIVSQNSELQFQEVTSLGEGTACSGLLSSSSMEKTLKVLNQFKCILKENDIECREVIFCATEACRLAKNRDDFFRQVALLGFIPQLITSELEAYLGCYAVLLDQANSKDHISLDIGGASTEVAKLNAQLELESYVSLKLGTLAASDLSTADVRSIILPLEADLLPFKNKHIVCTRGTMTTIFNLAFHNFDAEERSYNNYKMNSLDLMNALVRLTAISESELMRKFPYLKTRIKTLPGAIKLINVLAEILTPQSFELSDKGLTFGAIKKLIK